MHTLAYLTAAAAVLAPSAVVQASPITVAAAAANCNSPNYAVVGYGAGTTGGGSGSGTTVTSCAALTTAAKAGGVIKVSGNLSGCGIVDLKSDTTVTGVGANSGLTGGGFRVKSANNVIIRNLKLKNSPEGKDLIEIQKSTKVWVDHMDLSNNGITGDKDFYDGLLDITHAADFITVSYTKFHDHWKGSLIGHSDNNAAEDKGKLHVTYHHNLFTNVNSRLPSVRFGTVHLYSSCYEGNPTSGINSRMGAQVLVEHSSFADTKLAIVTDLDSDQNGFAVSRDNVLSGSTTTRITNPGSLTSVPYSYTADAASCVCKMVKSFAGTGIVA
ncbi:pectate lyase B [Microdochium bolleyi]|uniref:Pectate lyase B n=1 Tax=Microdochium bolleyi TaxID=196109 RepID=A0A136IWU5_9PEZI|nr:pectate lyase B [Microdochium bolleyi]